MTTIHPNHQKVIDALTADPTALIEWAANEIVALGAKSEWDMEDNFMCTEALVDTVATHYGLPSGGDQSDEALEFYGRAARHLGLPSDWEDAQDEEEED